MALRTLSISKVHQKCSPSAGNPVTTAKGIRKIAVKKLNEQAIVYASIVIPAFLLNTSRKDSKKAVDSDSSNQVIYRDKYFGEVKINKYRALG